MAKIEIDEQDQQLLEMTKKIAFGDNRKDFLRLAKKVDPALPIPEVDSEDAIRAATAPLQEKIAKMEADNAAAARMQEWEAKRKPLRDKHGLGNEDIEKVEKFMTEKKIFDHEVGFDNYKRNQQIATPTTGYSSVEMPTTEGLLKDPIGWARTEGHKMIDEMKAAR